MIAACVAAHCVMLSLAEEGPRGSSRAVLLQMIFALIVIAITLAAAGAKAWVAWFVLVFICIYISAYAW